MHMVTRREPMASVDGAWLHMDDVDNLMVVTLVLIFDQPMTYEWIRRLVETRLLKLSRFRQRIVEPPRSLFGVRGAYWEEDPHFDIDEHIERVELDDRDDEAALHRLVSEVMSRPFDRSRPLWHFYCVPHYGQGSVLITRTHHCIADGLGLIYVLLSMGDAPDSDAIVGCGRPSDDGASPLAALGKAIGGAGTAVKLFLTPRDHPTVLKGPLTIEKRASWSTPVPLDAVKAASRRMGSSINDVLLTAVTGALRQYLLSREDVADDLTLRGVVPVNLRRREDAHLLGNRFGLVFLTMPVGLADPTERLAEIGRRMKKLKRSLEPLVTFQVLRAVGRAPRPVFDFVVRMFGRKATAVVTNVIGPREPITFGGIRMSQAMFWVPCSGKLGLGISILSYAGRVSVGFASDAGLVPDPAAIVKRFDTELAGLLECAPEEISETCCVV